MKNSVALGVSLSVGALVVLGGAGALVWFLTHHKATTPAPAPSTAAPTPPAGTVAIGGGATAPVGAPADFVKLQQQMLAQQQAQAAKEAEWRKNDAISRLRTELGNVQNEIKRYTDQLNGLDQQSIPADIIAAVSDQHVADCRAHTPFGLNCSKKHEAVTEGYDRVAADLWATRKAEQKRPILVQLSELNTRQLDLIKNLQGLGVTVPKVNVPRA